MATFVFLPMFFRFSSSFCSIVVITSDYNARTNDIINCTFFILLSVSDAPHNECTTNSIRMGNPCNFCLKSRFIMAGLNAK